MIKYQIRIILLQPSGKAHTWGTQVLWAGHKGCKNIFLKQWNCSETGCQLMFLLEWCRVLVLPTQSGCCSKTEKEKKKRHSRSKRSPNYVTGSALLTDIMWDALFSKFLHLTSKNYVYFMDHKREIFFLTVNLGHVLWYLFHTAWAASWAVNGLSSSNLHIPVT